MQEGDVVLTPVPQADGANDLYIQQDTFHALFCPDVPEPQARRMAATQRAATDVALYEKASGAAWKTIPSWFVWGELDKLIPAAAHRFMAERANAREALEIKGSSHVVFVSYADTVAARLCARPSKSGNDSVHSTYDHLRRQR